MGSECFNYLKEMNISDSMELVQTKICRNKCETLITLLYFLWSYDLFYSLYKTVRLSLSLVLSHFVVNFLFISAPTFYQCNWNTCTACEYTHYRNATLTRTQKLWFLFILHFLFEIIKFQIITRTNHLKCEANKSLELYKLMKVAQGRIGLLMISRTIFNHQQDRS